MIVYQLTGTRLFYGESAGGHAPPQKCTGAGTLQTGPQPYHMPIFTVQWAKKSHFSLYQKCSVTHNVPKMHLRPRLLPEPPWGSLRRSPDTLVGCGEDTVPRPHPAWHLDDAPSTRY